MPEVEEEALIPVTAVVVVDGAAAAQGMQRQLELLAQTVSVAVEAVEDMRVQHIMPVGKAGMVSLLSAIR